MADHRFPSSGSGAIVSTAEQHEWWQRQITRRRFLAGSGIAAAAGPAVWLRTSSSYPSAPPSGIHLAYGSDPTSEMSVTWQVNIPVVQPYLRLGTSRGALTEKIGAELKNLTTAFPGQPLLEQYYVQARVRNLQPDTTYYYTIGHEGHPGGTPRSFRTAPQPNSGRLFTFTAFGDQSVHASAHAMDRVVAAQRPAFHLLAGDIAYADNDGRGYRPARVKGLTSDVFHPGIWDQYLAQIAPVASQIPWMVTMGNHDMEALYSPNGYGGQLSRFAFPGNGPVSCPTVYSFTYENVAFLALDANDVSYEIRANLGYSDGEQTKWIAAELSKYRSQAGIDFIVVFLHHCAYSTGRTHGSDGGVREHWSPLFDQYQVDLVINGHNHIYERTDPIRGGIVHRAAPAGTVVRPATDGTTYLTAGGGGRDVALFPVGQSYAGHVDNVESIRTQYWAGARDLKHQEVQWSQTRFEGYSVVAVDVVPGHSGRTTQMTLRTLDTAGTEVDRVILQRTAGQAWSPADELSTVAF
ncbi:MAG: metallophosphoesterase family protein [Actinomycetota bacterium]|nr:metallophosphoesterase family protein [Actinomycetota bacterium]